MNPTQQKPRAAKRAIPCIGLFMTRRSKPTTPTITVTNDQEELVLSKTATRKTTSRLRCALAQPFVSLRRRWGTFRDRRADRREQRLLQDHGGVEEEIDEEFKDAASVEAPDVPQQREDQGSVRGPPGKYVLELDFSHIKEMETASWLRERRPETPAARKMGPAFSFRRPMTSRGARPMY
ncbi:hypothetical protein HYQ45_001032 [Verticillium longisporum]